MRDNLGELNDKFDFLSERGVDGMYFCKKCGCPAMSRSFFCETMQRWTIERVRCHLGRGCGNLWQLKREIETEHVTVQ